MELPISAKESTTEKFGIIQVGVNYEQTDFSYKRKSQKERKYSRHGRCIHKGSGSGRRIYVDNAGIRGSIPVGKNI